MLALKKKRQKQAIAETEPVIPQATNDNKSSSVKRKKMVSQESKVTQESQIGAWSYVNNNQVEEEESKEKEEESKEYGDYDQQKDEEEEDYYYYQGEEEGEVHAKRARYNQVPQAQAQVPPPPPPPPGLPQNNEALSNLIMAWYYAGYYTGLYQVRLLLLKIALGIFNSIFFYFLGWKIDGKRSNAKKGF